MNAHPYQHGMSAGRLKAANVAIGILLVGSLIATIARKEFWPFSHYPMYADCAGPRKITLYRLYGDVADEPGREHLLLTQAELQPFSPMRISMTLHKLATQADSHTQQVALRALLRNYEGHRVEGRHTGPRLQNLKIYANSWNIDASTTEDSPPDARVCIAQLAPEI